MWLTMQGCWVGCGCVQGRTAVRPYGVGDEDNTVKMIGHDHPFIQLIFLSNLGRTYPFLSDDATNVIQRHSPFADIAKPTLPLVGAKGNKICPWLSIVVSFQADRTTMMLLGVKLHYERGSRCKGVGWMWLCLGAHGRAPLRCVMWASRRDLILSN